MKNKKTAIKFISVLLVLVMIMPLITIIPRGAKSSIPEILGAKGTDFTDNSYMAEKIEELFYLLPYSDYPYFTTYGNKSCSNSSCSYCNCFNVSRYHPNLKDLGIVDNYYSWSCFGFARYAFLYIFGEPADKLNYFGNTTEGTLRRVGRVAGNTNDRSSLIGGYESYTRANLIKLLEKATTGDIIQTRNRTSDSIGNHTMIFLSADDEGIYVLQNNMFRTRTDKNGNYYGYNRTMVSYVTYSTIMETWNSVVSVLRASKETYDATWSKGYNVCVNHSYDAAHQNVCTNCGVRFEPDVKTEEMGLYTVSSSKNLYSKPYTTSEIKGSVSGVVTVMSTEINSIGEKWFKTPEGYYFKEGGVSPRANSENLTISMTSYPVGAKELYSVFSLKGRIFSLKDELKNVSGYIVNSSGKTLQTVVINPDAQSLDVQSSKLNYNLRFGQLTIGEYYLVITAADGDGCRTMFTSKFKITENAEAVVKTQKSPPPAPTPSVVNDTFVLLDYVDGYEYSMDGETWQTGNLFMGLNPNTAYKFYCRYAETETTYASSKSPVKNITTLKPQVAAQMPTLDGSAGDTWVRLTAVKEHEYSKDGKNWQSSPLFTGLKPATQYIFFQRDKDVKKSSSALIVVTSKTKVDTPDAPTILGISDTTITIQYTHGFEYAIYEYGSAPSEIKWQDESFKGTFTGLSPAKEYIIYCRIKETDVSFASGISSGTREKTDKTFPAEIPASPEVLSKNSTSVTFKPVDGLEYSIDGENFQKSNVFKGLLPGVKYEAVCRFAETSTSYASEISLPAQFELVPDVITSSLYTINEEKKIISGVKKGTTVSNLLSGLDQGRFAEVKNGEEYLGGGTVLVSGNEIIINDMEGTVASYFIAIEGDLNFDGEVNISDMLLLLSLLCGHEPANDIQFTAGDLNGDGRINSIDYAMIRSLMTFPNEIAVY